MLYGVPTAKMLLADCFYYGTGVEEDEERALELYEEYFNDCLEKEFIYEEDNTTYHGIIDLMLVYKDNIKIIDYKLKNISDEAYLKQLNGYKEYIEKRFNKPAAIYLYSVINNTLEKL